MTQERKFYDREFKQKAVELSYARDNTKEIAEEEVSESSYYIDGDKSLRSMRTTIFPVKENPR
jgi:transposase